MAGILPPQVTQDRGGTVQCSAMQCLIAGQLTVSSDSLSSSRFPRWNVWEKLCRSDLPSLGVSWVQCRRHTFFRKPVRPNLLSVWRESISGVLVDAKRQPMGSALHYSLMGDACVSDDEMCLRKRSARERGWDFSTAVRPEPESLGPFYACHCHCHSPNSDFRSRTRNPFQ